MQVDRGVRRTDSVGLERLCKASRGARAAAAGLHTMHQASMNASVLAHQLAQSLSAESSASLVAQAPAASAVVSRELLRVALDTIGSGALRRLHRQRSPALSSTRASTVQAPRARCCPRPPPQQTVLQLPDVQHLVSCDASSSLSGLPRPPLTADADISAPRATSRPPPHRPPTTTRTLLAGRA